MSVILPDYLLDTGVANRVALEEPAILQRLAHTQSVFVPDIVLGELYFGAYLYTYRHNSTKFLDIYDAFYMRYCNEILYCDDETARIYGAISAELTAKGGIMQQNDMWIAALSRQYNLTLATMDSDFQRIPGLSFVLFSH